MKREFKVGDRVAVYAHYDHGNSATTYEGWKAEIIKKDALTGILTVRGEDVDGLRDAKIHPKQCRHLKKKERRRVWCIALDGKTRYGAWNADEAGSLNSKDYGPNAELVEFIEVRKRK